MIDPEAVFAGREVVATVKMDGECLVGSTRVKLANGDTKTLKQLVSSNMIDEYVLGYKDGKIIPSRILRTFDNGGSQSSDWYKISVRTPNGGPSRKTYCTSNHKWFTQRGWIAADKLQINDIVSYCKSQYGCNIDQRSILLGKVIGDGSIHSLYDNSTSIQYSHKKEHIEYLDYVNLLLGDITNGKYAKYTSGYGTEMITSWTKYTHDLYEYFSKFINDDGDKVIPEFVVDDITILGLMLWYLDDGNLVHTDNQRDRMQFSVCGYDESSCIVLQKCLLKYNIESKLHKYSGYYYISVNADNTIKFSELICRMVPKVMRYKLPYEYRDVEVDNLDVNSDCEYLHHEMGCKIDNITQTPHRVERRKYDIETETNNYFANGVLVHNCTTMYPDYIHARSIDSSWHESRSWVNRMQGELGWQLKENERICGENMYAEHSIFYKDLKGYFYVFNYWVDDVCQSWDDTVARAEELGLPVVDVIYRGIWDAELIKGLISKTHEGEEMEGYVVRFADAFTHDFSQTDKMPMGKYVRKDHVQTDQHWSHKVVVPNQLKEQM